MTASKTRMPLWGALLIVLLAAGNIAMAYQFIFSGSTKEVVDQRSAILLNDAERNLVLSEMRQFLAATQGITAALARDDMDAVAEHARSVGGAAAQQVPGTLMAKLPLEFKKLGFTTHQAFDELAIDAGSLADREHALEQLSILLSNCVACHTAFQIKTTDLPSAIRP